MTADTALAHRPSVDRPTVDRPSGGSAAVGAAVVGPAAVVLVHGTRLSHSQWDLQAPSLRMAGYEVVTPDLPGHGARQDETFTLDGAIATIRAAIDEAAARVDRRAEGSDGPEGSYGSAGSVGHDLAMAPTVHLVGSSLGGFLALHAAAEAPARLASLTLCGAAVQPTPSAARAYGHAIMLLDRMPGHRDGSGGLLPFLLGDAGTRALVRGGRASTAVVAPAMEAVGSLDLLADLHRVEVPVTWLHGRFDQLRLHERRFAAAAADGRLETLAYGSHLVNLADARRFTPDLLRVLGRVGPVPAPRRLGA
ncbi:alpha/beta fold hydrolase [Brachybacterium sp. DNPG3]